MSTSLPAPQAARADRSVRPVAPVETGQIAGPEPSALALVPDRTVTQPYQLVGRIEIRPALRGAEHEYLLAFAESRRWQRPGGPYVVPDNPLAECMQGSPDLERYVAVADGQPGPHCPWRPDDDARGLVPHVDRAGGTSVPPSEVIAWLSYLCDHFLRPDGLAGAAPECAEFGFDHVLDGAVAICSPGSGALSVLRVSGNVLRVEEVSGGCTAPAA